MCQSALLKMTKLPIIFPKQIFPKGISACSGDSGGPFACPNEVSFIVFSLACRISINFACPNSHHHCYHHPPHCPHHHHHLLHHHQPPNPRSNFTQNGTLHLSGIVSWGMIPCGQAKIAQTLLQQITTRQDNFATK